MVSSRLSGINKSASLALTRVAAEFKQKGIKVYNFGIGEPDFTTPEGIINASYESARKGMTHYTPSSGLPQLRQAIAEKLSVFNGIDGALAEEVVATPTKFALYISLLVLLEPDDGVLIPEPYYLSYPDIVRLAGGKALPFVLPRDYAFDLEAAEDLVTPRTKVMIFNSPVNPTGKVYSEKDIRKLSDFVIDHDLMLISDEIYEYIIFKGKHFSPASIPEMRERTITVSGFSKSHAMTGWRIGYLHAPKEIADACDLIQQQTITCAPSISQVAAIEALKDSESPKKFTAEFRERRDIVVKMLNEIDGIDVIEPEGTFYAFPHFDMRAGSERFSSDLLKEYHVAVTPGRAFGERFDDHFRLSFAAKEEDLVKGIEELGNFMKARKAEQTAGS